jgi:DNA-binding IclR family transcriptional regulator
MKKVPVPIVEDGVLPVNSGDRNSFGLEPEEDSGKERQFITALARGLEVLRCFRPGDRLLGNKDIAKRTGLPRPTICRLTYTLTRMGYLNYSEKLGKYQLGTAVLSLGYSFLSNLDILNVAQPLMQDLADYSNTAVGVGARDRLGMVYLKGCYSTKATISLNMEAGTNIAIATTSMGKALLCGMPEHEREILMDHIRSENPKEWPQRKAGIEKALRDYQEYGFCYSIGEWRKDVSGVAVPMLSFAGSQLLSFNCAAPSFVLKRQMIEEDIGPRLVHMVRSVEARVAVH